MYVKRTIEEAILRLGQSFPCIVIYGARQVGKSTTIQHIFGQKYNQDIQPGLVIDTCEKIRPINEMAWMYPVYLLGL